MIDSDIGVFHFLTLGIILFIIGFLGIISSKNLVKILLSLGIIYTSVCINFVAISQYCDGLKLEGTTFCIFIILTFFIHLIIFVSIVLNRKFNITDKIKR